MLMQFTLQITNAYHYYHRKSSKNHTNHEGKDSSALMIDRIIREDRRDKP